MTLTPTDLADLERVMRLNEARTQGDYSIHLTTNVVAGKRLICNAGGYSSSDDIESGDQQNRDNTAFLAEAPTMARLLGVMRERIAELEGTDKCTEANYQSAFRMEQEKNATLTADLAAQAVRIAELEAAQAKEWKFYNARLAQLDDALSSSGHKNNALAEKLAMVAEVLPGALDIVRTAAHSYNWKNAEVLAEKIAKAIQRISKEW